jgi:hypothetical protein
MATDIDYAVLSAFVYNDERGDSNLLPNPNGWTEIFYQTSDTWLSGLTAGVYLNTAGTEIVIAFKGTNTSGGLGAITADWFNDAANAIGVVSPQLIDAVSLYENIKNDPRYQLRRSGRYSLPDSFRAEATVSPPPKYVEYKVVSDKA